MKRYLFKRLLLMVFTLLGIAVITFAITRIAPGDPATLKLQASLVSPKSRPITRRMIEENRKLYGFDKPLFLNFRSKGKKAYILRLIQDFLQEKDPYFDEKYEKEILSMNMVAAPYIFEVLRSDSPLPEKKKQKLINFLYIFFEISRSPEKNLEYLQRYYAQIAPSLQPASLTEYLEDIIEKNLLFRKKDILAAKAASVPVLIQWVLDHKDRVKKLPAVVDMLAEVAQKPWRYSADMSETEKSELFYYILHFWKYNKEKYISFSFLERVGRVFSDTQFGIWMGKILTLDFDVSYAYKRPVSDLIAERLPVTLQLNIISLLLIYLMALYIGIRSSVIHNTRREKWLTLLLFILYSLPSFWVANLLILFFTGGDFLNLFPAQYLHSPDIATSGSPDYSFWSYFLDWLWHLVLPITTLTYGGLAYLSRQMKVSMLEALHQDYIRTARAKGLPEKLVVYRHALRNALIPIITLLGGLLPAMLGGSIIVEEIFTINGMGKLSFEAIINRDYPVVNAIAFLSAFLTLLGIFISDLLYVWVDPRIKLEKIKM